MDSRSTLRDYSDNRFVCDFSSGLKFIAIEVLVACLILTICLAFNFLTNLGQVIYYKTSISYIFHLFFFCFPFLVVKNCFY